MTFVLGRRERQGVDRPTARLGRYRALDGSDGAPLAIDLDSPHAVMVVGKRGYGKSYTLGVLAEALAQSRGLAPVILDPMGALETLTSGDTVPATVVSTPTVAPDSLDPRSWCDLLDLSPDGGAGGLLWRAAGERSTLAGMQETIRASDGDPAHARAACNHLDLAESWGVFDADGLDASDLTGPEATVLDLSSLKEGPANAVARGVAETLYRARVDGDGRLPWLLVDEAHAFFDGIAGPALDRLLTRGRAPGVSLVLATQRPSALPQTAISQSDLLLSHRLTARSDLAALETARPTYLDETLSERMPAEPGDVLVVDDTTETVHAATVRARKTPHGGDSPRASECHVDCHDSSTVEGSN